MSGKGYVGQGGTRRDRRETGCMRRGGVQTGAQAELYRGTVQGSTGAEWGSVLPFRTECGRRASGRHVRACVRACNKANVLLGMVYWQGGTSAAQ